MTLLDAAPRPVLQDPPRPPRASPADRIPGLDPARFLASLGVLWSHFGTPGYNTIGYFRMPFFTLTLVYLTALPHIHGRPASFPRLLRTRATRLLLPFALWTFIHWLLWEPLDTNLPDYGLNWWFFGLGGVHLWFLPFAFCASLLTWMCAHLLARSHHRCRMAAFLCAAGLLACAVTPEGIYHDWLQWWELWLPLAGVIPMGAALPVLWANLPARRGWPRAAAWALACAALTPLTMLLPVSAANFLGTLSGAALFFAGAALPLDPRRPLWKYLGALSFGTYLSHYAIGRLLCHYLLGWTGNDALRYALVVLLSVCTAALLLALPPLHPLLGEPMRKPTRSTPSTTPCR